MQFMVTLEKDSTTDDLWLPLPADLLTLEDWRVGDRLLVEVLAFRRLIVTNLGKQERGLEMPWAGLPVRDKKREYGNG